MMKKIAVALSVIVGLAVIAPTDAQAIPAFARKYGFNCNMCHAAFTKLNDFGQRVRDNGYQIPGQAGLEKNVFETAPPISFRTAAGMIVSHESKNTTSGFTLNGLDLLAAGVLHKNISFLLIYTPRIDEPAADYSGNPDGTNFSQPGALESANIVFSNIVPDMLNIRVGRFEPAYHPFSSKRSYYLLQPYEVYGVETPNNGFIFDDNQLGIEATGHLKNGFKYGLGVVNGSGSSPDNNNAKDIYVNLFQTVGRGDGQSAGHRLGAFAYYGWQPTDDTIRISVRPDSGADTSRPYVGSGGEADRRGNVGFYRVGGDVSLNWRTFNLKVFYMYGSDDKKLNPYDSSKSEYIFQGGFARLDWAGLMNNRLVVSGLFNWVRRPCEDSVQPSINAGAGLVRYYLGDWMAVNIALHLEYAYREFAYEKADRTHKQHDHTLAALIDFDF